MVTQAKQPRRLDPSMELFKQVSATMRSRSVEIVNQINAMGFERPADCALLNAAKDIMVAATAILLATRKPKLGRDDVEFIQGLITQWADSLNDHAPADGQVQP